jgi:N-acetylglucosaminyldiphosphoundecaprenol N-acetyl-beta-D-mannosaminyltransferase
MGSSGRLCITQLQTVRRSDMPVAILDEISVSAVKQFDVLGVPVAAVDMASAIETVRAWISNRDQGRMVTFATVHMVVEALKNKAFAALLETTDVNFPDGMPLVWAGRHRGLRKIGRVCGPEFMPAFCEATAGSGIRHFFYGGTEGVPQSIADRLSAKAPDLQVVGAYSPPFGAITPEQDEEIVQMINRSQPDAVWVCLGCPKQELWMAQHRHRLNAKVLLAVGLAFDIVAGHKKRAPEVLQRYGLEWLYRLFQEPRRLWRRYLVFNGFFVYRYLVWNRWERSRRRS